MEKPTNQNAGGLPNADPSKPKRGGFHPGADHPKKAKFSVANIHNAELLICKKNLKLLGKRSDFVAGVKVVGKSSREVVYEHPPDSQVVVGLLNCIMEKPVERVQTENTGNAALRASALEL